MKAPSMRCQVYPAGKNVSTSVRRPGPAAGAAGKDARGGNGHAGGGETRTVAHAWHAGDPVDGAGGGDANGTTAGGRGGEGTGAARGVNPVAGARAGRRSADGGAGGGGGNR